MRELTLAEIDAEVAEQLPARELLCCGGGGGNTHIVANGNTSQVGLINVSALNGNFNGNHVNVLGLL
jgi:hypothetical protein